MVSCKTRNEIELMRKAGQVVGRTIEELKKHVRPGITSLELDRIADEYIRSQDCTPAFFQLYNFPEHICISFNEEIVHGIPSNRVLKEGDIISLDVGATYKGWNGDASVTVPVGKVSPEVETLLRATEEALYAGIRQMRLKNYLFDISAAVEDKARPHRLGVIEPYGGHGIGRKVHEDPFVPNVHQPSRGMALRKGMCLAVEPMFTLGSIETEVKPDQWTVVTKDGKFSAHFEHSIAITDGEPIILTAP